MQPMSPQQAFAALERTEQLDALVHSSFSRPALIIKHSPACGTSFQALDELEEHREQLDGLDVHLIDVLRQRALSQTIASRFQIRHESPQVLLLVNGHVQWNASHFGVTADRVRQALVSVLALHQTT
jgi:bacillithiol system protein YtxJ